MPCQVRRLVKLGIDKRDPDALTADEIRSVSFALSHPSNHVECFFLHSNPYGSPLLESLPSWTSTRARSPGRGFWTPTTGRFDLYIVRKHKSDKLDNNTVPLQIPEKDHCGTEPDREGSDQVSLISKCITSWISFLSLTWLMCCYRETQFDITVARWNSIWYFNVVYICVLYLHLDEPLCPVRSWQSWPSRPASQTWGSAWARWSWRLASRSPFEIITWRRSLSFSILSCAGQETLSQPRTLEWLELSPSSWRTPSDPTWCR